MSYNYEEVTAKVADTLVRAGSTFRQDKKDAYLRAIAAEELPRAKWNLETILANAEVAQKNRSPLCDDTGIPHVFIEVGPQRAVTGELLSAIQEGIRSGLRELPGRPMAILGNDEERIDMSGGISPDSDALALAPVLIKEVEEDVLRVHVLLLGGGPAIRGLTQRIFHKHSVQVVLDEIVSRAKDATRLLGCTPCAMAIGIGRSQYEATALMMEAIASCNFGAGQLRRCKSIFKMGLSASLVLGAFLLIVCLLFPSAITHLFMQATEEVMAIAPAALRIYAFSLLPLAVNIFSSVYFQSVMRAQASAWISVLRGVIVICFLLYLLPSLIGGEGIWLSFTVSEYITSVFTAICIIMSKHAAAEGIRC